ncbi:MAG: glycosyltransferase family 9 protein [Planctomycetaceae bacterium]|nr:glycosyltransferase family 9 protein [Planctomycetaceae bacterium]
MPYKPFSFVGKTFLPKELANPRRILITNFGNTAETIQSLPILVAVKHRFPHAEIAWLIGAESAPLISDHWAINRFIIIRKDWLKHPSEIRRTRKRLQAFAPQVAIDPQSSFASAFASWLANAHYRIGFAGKYARFFYNVRVLTDEKHQIYRKLHLLQPFGIYGCDIAFDMPDCEKDKITARNILHQKGLLGNFALLHVSAERPEARWQEERFGAVARHLLEEWNLPSLITWCGGDQEYRRAESVIHFSGGAALQSLETTLAQRGALAKSATVFIGSDSAELQLAAAVGTQTIGLFGTPSTWDSAPLGLEHRSVLAKSITKYGSKRILLQDGMEAIQSRMVMEKSDELLSSILQPSVLPLHQVPAAQKKAA